MISRRRCLALVRAFATVTLLTTACGEDTPGSDATDVAGLDTANDVFEVSRPDTPGETTGDMAPESVGETNPDVYQDARGDTVAETGADTAQDSASDAAGEMSADATGDAVQGADAIVAQSSSFVAWNNAALQAIAAANLMPPQGTRILAMLHVAMYDAVNSVEQRGQPFKAEQQAPDGASAEAAAAQAASVILKTVLPEQAETFEALRLASLEAVPDGQSETDGLAVGDAAAAALIEWRANDGSQMMMGGDPYMGGTEPGQWRPTPPDFLPGMFARWGMVTPFAMSSGDQFRPGPPPSLDSAEYAQAFNETQEIGAKNSQTRTMEQSMMATFWVGMPGTIMEAGRMNLVVQQAAAAHEFSLFELARLFALVNVAMADAAIAGLDCKYHYAAWRPVTAIQEAESDGNPDTLADPAWESLLVTPAHPEYNSTHSALTSAAAETLLLFFGDDAADITLPSFMNPDVTRQYSSFSQVAQEAGLGRIYGGIHFRFSYDAGSQTGRAIGQYVWNNFFRLL